METLKKKKQMPNTIVIILLVIFLACLVTWIIPAGEYVRIEDASGSKVIDPTSFSYIERTPVNPLKIPTFIVQGFKNQIDLFLLILFSGGLFQFVNTSGALQSLVAKVAKKYSNRTWIFIVILSLMFCLICTTKAVNTFIPFAPIFVLLGNAMGFDAIVGVGIILLGGAVGFSTGTIGGTTKVAQEIAGLPLFSGIEYRAICLVVFFVITMIYLVRYANKIKKNPESSYMYDLKLASGEVYDENALEAFGTMDTTKWMVLGTLVATIAIIVFGSIQLGWKTPTISAAYLWGTVAMGAVMRLSPSQTVKEFLKGAQGMLFAGCIVCLANAVVQILNAGHIIDTIVYGLALALNAVPSFLKGPAMYIANIIINIPITSGNGQASVVMPIMAPVADMINMTRQTAVLALNFGDGFCNYILPTSSALMGILGAGNVPYDRWMKFMWKLFLIWIVVGSILLMIAHAINFGPF